MQINPQKIDPQPGHYYVSCINADRYGLLLGPFRDHPLALALVRPVQDIYSRYNHWANFYSFGTANCTEPPYKPGQLNVLFGLKCDRQLSSDLEREIAAECRALFRESLKLAIQMRGLVAQGKVDAAYALLHPDRTRQIAWERDVRTVNNFVGKRILPGCNRFETDECNRRYQWILNCAREVRVG